MNKEKGKPNGREGKKREQVKKKAMKKEVVIARCCKEVILIMKDFSPESMGEYKTLQGLIAAVAPNLRRITACTKSTVLWENEEKELQKGLVTILDATDLLRLQKKGLLLIKQSKKRK